MASEEMQQQLEPGRNLAHGKFTLQKCVGRGGMGQVWLAVDNSLTRPGHLPHQVALKFLTRRLADDQKARARLKEEVLRGLRLNLDHIVRIHSWHEEPGEPVFFAMEYARGESLSSRAQKLPGQRFTWLELAPIAKQLCEALSYAHARQVIHRDLKPGNILLTADNVVKLADFGLARGLGRGATESLPTAFGGTPGYMSPQQREGKTPAPSDDIYSLGATLYEALIGTASISHGGLVRPISEALRQFPRHDVPPNVQQTITACLGPREADRPTSVEEVERRLGFYSSVDEEPPPQRRRISTSVWVAAALALLACGGFIAWKGWPKGDKQPQPQPQPQQRPVIPLAIRVVRPASGTSLVSPANPELEASVEGANDPVRWVEFQTNGVPITRVLQEPFRFAWQVPPAGAYSVTAMVIDNKGLTATSSPILLTILPPTASPPPSPPPPTPLPPTVRLVRPASACRLISPATLDLEAKPEAPGGSIQSVEFQANSVTVAKLTSAPYTFSWGPVQAGVYAVTAMVTDDKGISAASGAVKVTVTEPPAPPPKEPTPDDGRPKAGKGWTNSLGMEFVPLPGGGGWLSRHETRLKDYLQFRPNHVTDKMSRATFGQQSNLEPVVMVNATDAQNFCQWLSQREQQQGKLGMQHRYRLPRVSEWKTALGLRQGTARAGGSTYLWGSSWPPLSQPVGNLGGRELRVKVQTILTTHKDTYIHTAAVGSFGTNANGFCDLVGNVWELCEKPANDAVNIVRLGGAWDTTDDSNLRPSREEQIREYALGDNLGFRCFLADEQANSGPGQRSSSSK